MAARLARRLCALAALAAATFPAAASADPVAGITGAANLVLFDTASPGSLTTRPITGLQTSTEKVVGLDRRPATGGLFLITVPTGVAASATIRSYSLDPATRIATFVGSIPGTVPGAADTPTGVDFNPIVDRLRVVNANNESFRINPTNGALAGDDVNLTYSAPTTGPVTAVAYDRNVAPGPPGTPAPPGARTTLYGLDVGADRLVTIGGIGAETPGGPNGGTVAGAGALGVAVDNTSDAGFDIAANGSAFASLTVAGQPGLYRVNLAGGTATLIGALPAQIRALTVTGPDNCPGVAGDNQSDVDGDGLGDACDSDELAPTFTFTKVARRITLKRFLKRGVSARITPSEFVTLEVALLARARGARIARAGDLVLAERKFGLSAAARTVRLKPRRKLVGAARRFAVRLRVIATDSAGNRSAAVVKTVRVRAPRR